MAVKGDSEYWALYQALRRTQGFGLFFVECPHCCSARFVLFGSPAAMTQLMRQAPDFFDWRSGWFRF
jgi:hypothetical protein